MRSLALLAFLSRSSSRAVSSLSLPSFDDGDTELLGEPDGLSLPEQPSVTLIIRPAIRPDDRILELVMEPHLDKLCRRAFGTVIYLIPCHAPFVQTCAGNSPT